MDGGGGECIEFLIGRREDHVEAASDLAWSLGMAVGDVEAVAEMVEVGFAVGMAEGLAVAAPLLGRVLFGSVGAGEQALLSCMLSAWTVGDAALLCSCLSLSREQRLDCLRGRAGVRFLKECRPLTRV